jgi:hypothetical protein
MRSDDLVGVRLKGGASGVDGFEAEAHRRGLTVELGPVPAEQAKLVQRAIRPQAVALWFLAALLAVAAVAVLGQALARQAFLESADNTTLWSLGSSRGQLWGLGMARAGAIALVGGLLSVIVAVVLSPLTPIGLARTVEPHPGILASAGPLAAGGGATLLLVVLVAALPAWWASRVGTTSAAGPAPQGRSRPSVVAGALARAGIAPTAVTGVRMALEPGRRPRAVPERDVRDCRPRRRAHVRRQPQPPRPHPPAVGMELGRRGGVPGLARGTR